MKVILIKDCKEGKENEIVDVTAGYATNFLIKNGFGVPFNPKTKKELAKRLKVINDTKEYNYESALKVKSVLEKLVLKFYLDVTNNKIHGSVTRKQIVKALRDKGINLDTKIIDNNKIESIGISKVKVYLQKDVIAELKVEVKENGK